MRLSRSNTTALAAVLLTLLFSLPALAQTFGESIGVGETLRDTLTTAAPLQVYSFEAEAGAVYRVEVEADALDVVTVDVVDADGVSIAEPVPSSGVRILTAEVLDAGTYYVIISSSAAAVGVEVEYSVSINLDAGTAPVAGTTPTAGTTPATMPTAGAAATATPADVAITGTPGTPAATLEGTPGAVNQGQLVVSGFSIGLSWTGAADLDLEIRDPIGGSLYWETPSVESGGTISPNVNQGCANVNADTPAETATWTPGGIPTGSYEVLVYYQQACAGDVPINFTVSPALNGTELPAITGSVQPGQVYVSRVEVFGDGTSNVAQQGGIVVLENLPFAFADIQANAVPLELETTFSGFISNEAPFNAFTFEGVANDILSINAFATTGSLDTFVALLDVSGNIIAFNDDLGVGVTDSLIDGVLLPTSGTYYVVVTRYGKNIGGTEGGASVLVTRQAVNLGQEFLALPEGSLEVLLLWNTSADLQLLVRDAAGDSVFDDIPRITSGGVLAAQGNVNCSVSEGTPFSYIYWPPERQPRPGVYEVEVWFQSECNDTSPVNMNLYVTLNGRQVIRANASPVFNERFLTSFTINPDGSTIPSEAGIIRGLETLDYQSETPTSDVLAGEQYAGTITQDNKFDVYTYDGTANDSVTIALNATSGTLDTTLYLVSPSGQLIAENDDAVPGENTNSLIADFTLPEDGPYIIIVTHYGALYGGTTGTYTLTLTELN